MNDRALLPLVLLLVLLVVVVVSGAAAVRWDAPNRGTRDGVEFSEEAQSASARTASLPADPMQPGARREVIDVERSNGSNGNTQVRTEGAERPESGWIITGRVTSADGRPIEHVRIETVPTEDAGLTEGMLSCDTDAEGRFRCGPLPLRSIRLDASHPACTPFARLYSPHSGDVWIELHPAPALEVVVRDALDGDAVAVTHAMLLVSTRDEEGPWNRSSDWREIAESQSEPGRFRLPVPPQRFLRVLVRCQDLTVARSGAVRWTQSRRRSAVEIRKEAGAPITGFLRDGGGIPVSGAEIRVRTESEEGSIVIGTCRSSPNGSFRSPPLSSGTYRVEAQRDGFSMRPSPRDSVTVRADLAPPPIELSLWQSGAIRGRIVTGNERSIAQSWVSAHALSGPAALDGTSVQVPTCDGEFQIEPLLPGSYRVALMTGRPPHSATLSTQTVAVDAGEEQFLELADEP